MALSFFRTFFQRGTSTSTSPSINKRIVLTNYVLTLIIIAYPIGYVIDQIQESINDPLSTTLIVVYSLACIGLNQNGYNTLARVGTLLLILLTPIYYCQYYDREGGMILLYTVAIPAIFALFSLQEKGWIFLFLGINLLLGSYLEIIDYKLWSGVNKLPLEVQIDTFLPTFLLCNTCSFLATYWLTQQNAIAEKKLAAAVIKAREGEKAKSQFLSIMSHEIRTPLNGIIGLTDLLKSNREDIDKKLDVLYNASQNLKFIVDDVLDYSKIEEGKLSITPEAIKVQDIANTLAAFYEPLAAQKGLRFTLSVSPQIPESFMGDINRILQILHNLLNNAVKFTKEGSIQLNIEIDESSEGSVIQFKVIDTGIGIDSQFYDKIFNRFQQVEDTTSRSFEGTGLGLAISKLLAKLQNGSLTIHSKLGVGSTFCFSLPYTEACLVNADKPEKALLKEDLLVMYIEDNEINQFVTKHIFDHHGVKYKTYIRPEDAIAASTQSKFDVIITDYHMPNINGIELAKQIRSNSENPNQHTPILMLTADVQLPAEDIKSYINAVAQKPIKAAELIRSISTVVSA